jgi:sialate O-acetylesterase
LVVALLACVLVVQSVAAAAPRIEVRSPRAWQVVQRDARGRGDIVVSGRCFGLGGSVRVSWGDRRATARCDRAGRFTARLDDVPAGQATLRVWSARRPGVTCSLANVGVGDIYVIAGQSNASGRSPALYSYSDPTLHAAMFGNDYRWQELRDPVDSAAGQVDVVSKDPGAGGSVWPEVATQLLAAEGVPVAFVPCAHVSTPIARWRPDLSPGQHLYTLYSSMARRTAAVGGRIRAVLWWQGEKDARELTPGLQYEAAVQDLAAAIWRDFRAPLVVAQIGDYGSAYTGAGVDAVRHAQQRAWRHPHILQGPVLYDIDLGERVHFEEPDDVSVAARRWAAAILRSLFHRDAGRTPRLVAAVREGDEVVLTADSPLAPAADLGGFIVRAGGRKLPITSALAEGDTVRLLLGESAEGPVRVSLGEGRSGAGAAVPTDASAWRLPMLPFVDHPVVGATP